METEKRKLSRRLPRKEKELTSNSQPFRKTNAGCPSRKGKHKIAEKAYRLILAEKMRAIEKPELLEKIRKEVIRSGSFNVYAFVENYLSARK